MATVSASRTLFAVDYERQPFCYVRAGNTSEAIGIAERFLAMRLRGQVRHASPGKAPVAKPSGVELTKLRARRPTASERCQFMTSSERNGVPSPYLAAVMAS